MFREIQKHVSTVQVVWTILHNAASTP